MPKPSFVFFGSSRFSTFVLEELEKAGLIPLLSITSSRTPLPSLEELRKLNADVFVVASFGKILPKDLLDLPKHGSINVHPSLLPELRGPAPIQGTILLNGKPGVTIIKMDEQVDHGPILAQESVLIEPFPDHYEVVEEKLARKGGALLASILPAWTSGTLNAQVQDDSKATYTKMIKTSDAALDLSQTPEENIRKVYAYSTEPGAHLVFKTRSKGDVRVKVIDAKLENGEFIPTRVIPAGKKEMDWQSFLRGNA